MNFTRTAGQNTGPTLSLGRRAWQPAAIGESLTWSGVSPALAGPRSIRWSSLVTEGGAHQTYLEPATQLIACGPADVNCDGFVDGVDFELFTSALAAGTPSADVDANGFVDGADVGVFTQAFDEGC